MKANLSIQSLSICSVLILATPASAVQVYTEDIEVEDTTPAVVFDDKSVADGEFEWYLNGRDEGFGLWDYGRDEYRMFFNPITDSIAIGSGSTATATRSIALNSFSAATGERSIAIGTQAKSQAPLSTAIGALALAANTQAMALGFAAESKADSATAIGLASVSEGIRGLAVGRGSKANGPNSTAIGYNSEALEAYSVALGAYSFADQPWTIVLGNFPREGTPDEYHNVAIGTDWAMSPLHIFREDNTREFLTLEGDEPGLPQDRAMMYLENNGGIRFEFRDSNKATGWRFQAQTGAQDRFEITKVGTGEIEYSFRPDGNLYIAGNVFTNSDRNSKREIVPVNGNDVLARLASLPIAQWSYTDSAHQRHLGPMAQDFHKAFGLGEGNTTLTATDLAGVSLVAAQELSARNASLQSSNEVLQEKDLQMEHRLDTLQRQLELLMSSSLTRRPGTP